MKIGTRIQFIKIALRLVLICLLAFKQGELSAQIKPLKIGDRCPDILIKNILGHDSSQLQLSSFKNKFLIIDFWSTSCSGCIKAMPRIDSIQDQHASQLQVLLVTSQQKGVVEKFWGTNQRTKNLSLVRVVEDKVLEKYFPHEGVPHYVWIDANRVVRAITSSDYVNKKNVETLLNGEKVNWIAKLKRDYDFNKPLLQMRDEISDSKLLYCSGISSYLPEAGIGLHSRIEKDSTKGHLRIFAINHSIPQLYRYALMYSSTKGMVKQFLLDLADSSRYVHNKNAGYAEAWKSQNSYCYEAILPINTDPVQVYSRMVDDLNNYFGMNGRMEKKLKDVLILVKLPGSQNNITNTDKPVAKHGTSTFVGYFDKVANFPIIIDSTDGAERINGTLLRAWKNIPELRSAMQKNGFDLIPSQMEIDIFILGEKTRK